MLASVMNPGQGALHTSFSGLNVTAEFAVTEMTSAVAIAIPWDI
jgi:hypothetical protein